MKLVTVLKRESPLTLAREALWRSQRRWRQAHFRQSVQRSCPVYYCPLTYYQPCLGDLDGPSRNVILRYADAIRRGEFPGFAYNPVALGFPPPWNVDFVSGHNWPQAPAETITIMRHDGSDIKVPWDLSRLQFLPVLGKAWCLSRDEGYRSTAKQLLTHWIEHNPVGRGVNWVIAMEVALRAISICLFLEFVSPGSAEDAWWREVTKSLWQHMMFIEANLEFSHFARGNHYLSNLVGLFCLSSFLHGSGMTRRRHSYRKLIEKEMLFQVYRDGGDYEASTGYHFLNLQMFTNAFLLMRRQQFSIRQEFADRLKRMYGFLAALADCHGTVPHIGDCDDGRVELLSDDLKQMFVGNCEDRHSLTVSGLLGVGQALFHENYRGHNKDAVWYGLSISDNQNEQTTEGCSCFPYSGIAVAHNKRLRVVFLAMPNGMKGKGTHTHNDKLSVLASLRGKPLLIDCGTGCYTRNSKRRNRFRSTCAHNTIQIDGREQNRFSLSDGSVFVIGDDARVTPIDIKETKECVQFSASHNGYDSLGVIHERVVELTSSATLTLRDQLKTAGRHTFEMRFHLHPRWQTEVLNHKGKQVACSIKDESTAVELICEGDTELSLSCQDAAISTAYGLVTTSTVITVNGAFEAAFTLTSRLTQLN